ncbi:unnamed protein product, partial [Rotaria magnacalcarata]
IKQQYRWIPFDVVVIFLSQCDVCWNRKAFPKPIADKPITSISFLTRIQMDLIDMRSIPDGGFHWILHTKDRFAKFSWAYALKTKEAQPVAEKLLHQFYSFEPPRILQSDNGKIRCKSDKSNKGVGDGVKIKILLYPHPIPTPTPTPTPTPSRDTSNWNRQ